MFHVSVTIHASGTFMHPFARVRLIQRFLPFDDDGDDNLAYRTAVGGHMVVSAVVGDTFQLLVRSLRRSFLFVWWSV